MEIGSSVPAPLSLLLNSRYKSKTDLRDNKESYLPRGALGDVLNKSIEGPWLESVGTKPEENIQQRDSQPLSFQCVHSSTTSLLPPLPPPQTSEVTV